MHHAVCAVITPIFEPGFICHSYANREGNGTHRAVARYERWRDRYRHVLRCDIYRYFPAIDHAHLKDAFRRRIVCPQTLWLLDAIVDGSNRQEAVNLYYPGDDLFAPFERRRGLPIGNLTSQFFANLYLDGLDHFVTEVLRAPYLRYVDDFALFHDDPAVLTDWRDRIAAWLARRRLSLHPRKTVILETDAPATFLGYELMPGRRRLPDANVRRFRNRLRGLRDRWRAGSVESAAVAAHVQAWIAHARHADTWRLRHAIFRDGWFDPARIIHQRRGSLVVPQSSGPARRFLEQQSKEPPRRLPQQERRGQPEQQHRFPPGQHASVPEPAGPRPDRARRG